MKIPKILILILACILLTNCGGGSEGTGVSVKSIQGSVRLDSGEPLGQASITVVETGVTAISDSEGLFFIETESNSTSLNLVIETDSIKASTELTGLDSTNSNLEVALTINPRGDASLATVGYLEVWARITGTCEEFFENKKVIRQKRAVPDDLRCTLSFFANGDGQRLEQIRGRIDVRTCDSDTWRPIAEGLTGTGIGAGSGKIDFDFIDNRRNCVYRFVAPVEDPLGRRVETIILTRTFQQQE